MAFIQKIYDNSLEQFVYYTKATVTATPLSNETTPNHSGNLEPSTHVILNETGANILIRDEGVDLTINTRSLNFVGADVVATASNDAVTVTVAGSGLAGSHQATHLSGAIDPVDGDKLDVDFTPTSYSRTIVGGLSTATNQLTSHLKGIDNYLLGLPSPGESNTASNLGSGVGWWSNKTGVDLRFKSALAGYGTVITAGTNENTVSLKTDVTLLTDSPSITINADSGIHYQVTIAGNRLFTNPVNTIAGKKLEILVLQDGVGDRRLSFDADWVPVGKTHQVALAPNAASVITAIARGVSPKWYYTIEHAENTEVTEPIVTVHQNNWLIDSRKFASLVRVSSDSHTREIRGIISPIAQSNENSSFTMVLTGSFYLQLKNEDAAASIVNRLLIPNGDLTIVPDDVVTFQYDFTSLRWRLK